MNPALANLPGWLMLLVSLVLLLGGVIILIGTLGLLRLPNFYQRIHGPSITITLGTGCLLIASMLTFSALEGRPVVHELLITVFILLTAPVTSMMFMRAAVYRDLRAGRVDRSGDSPDAYRFPLEK